MALPRPFRRPHGALYDVTNLAGEPTDEDGDGFADLLIALGLIER